MKQSKTSQRKPLSVAFIASSAIALADQDGLESLSMRKLAQKLEVEAMSLYHHLPSKAKLMEAMVQELVQELPAIDPSLALEAGLRRYAQSWRELAQRHPGCFPLLATRAQTPLPLLEKYGALLAMFRQEGFAPEAAARALSSFFFGLNGFLLAAGKPMVFRDIPEPTVLPPLSPNAADQFRAIPAEVWDLTSDSAFYSHLDFLLQGIHALQAKL